LSNIQESLLSAIDTIVSNRVESIQADKTITATVERCEEPLRRKYKILYNGGYIWAYAQEDKYYKQGDEVYILIPQNDMSQTKVIIGLADSGTIDSNISTISSLMSDYSLIGNNVVEDANNIMYEGKIGLSSYYSQCYITLYDYNTVNSGADTAKDMLQINQDAFKTYMNAAEAILIEGSFKTSLPVGHRRKATGQYGINFRLAFRNQDTGELYTKEYLLDSSSMTGSPLNYTTWQNQNIILPIDNENFDHIESIIAFSSGFVDQTESDSADSNPNNILIKALEIYCLQTVSDTNADSVLSISTPEGAIFAKDGSPDYLTAQAKLTVLTEDMTDRAKYYWFKKDARVSSLLSSGYSPKGGIGYKIFDDENNSYFNVKNKDCTAYENYYKCVATYNNEETVLSKEFIIWNNKYNYTATITSDVGTSFAFDRGKPVLTCSIYDPDNNLIVDNCYFCWSVENDGTTTVFDKTASEIETEMKNLLYSGTDAANEELLNKQQEAANVLTNISNFEKTIDDYYADSTTSNEDKFNNMKAAYLKTNFFNDDPQSQLDKWFGTDYNSDNLVSSLYQRLQKVIENQNSKANKDYQTATDSIANTLRSQENSQENSQEKLSQYNSLKTKLVNAKIATFSTQLGKNTFSYPMEQVDKSCTISCTVYRSNESNRYINLSDASATQIATASIVLTNTNSATPSGYTIEIKNANQTFQYNEAGISPCSSRYESPQVIYPLSFTFYDTSGQKVNLSKNGLKAYWKFPLEKTLINTPSNMTVNEKTGKAEYYKVTISDGVCSDLTFSIADLYDYSCTQNQIEVVIELEDSVYTKQTNFSFMKTGDNGTNGTSIYARITPSSSYLKDSILDNEPPTLCIYNQKITSDDSTEFNDNSESTTSYRTSCWNNNNAVSLDKMKFNLQVFNNNVDETSSATNISWGINDILGKNYSKAFEIDTRSDKTDISERKSTTISSIRTDEEVQKTSYLRYRNQIISASANVSSGRTCNNAVIKDDGNGSTSTTFEKSEVISNYTSYAFYPIPIIEYQDDIKNITITKSNLLREVTYNSSGYCPSYDDSLGLEINIPKEITYNLHITYEACGGEPSIEGEEDKYWSNCPQYSDLTVSFDTDKNSGKYDIENNTIQEQIFNENDSEENEIQEKMTSRSYFISITPNDFYNGQYTNNMVVCHIKTEDDIEIATIYSPVYMHLNTYSLSSLNGWDGTSISLSDDNAAILAPQVGAGEKDSDNTFTGIVMGIETTAKLETDEEGKQLSINKLSSYGYEDKVGLFGYNKGQRSIFLDAKTGSATFGLPSDNNVSTDGQIELIPGGVSKIGSWKFGKSYLYNFKTPSEPIFTQVTPDNSDKVSGCQLYVPVFKKTTNSDGIIEYESTNNYIADTDQKYSIDNDENYQEDPTGTFIKCIDSSGNEVYAKDEREKYYISGISSLSEAKDVQINPNDAKDIHLSSDIYTDIDSSDTISNTIYCGNKESGITLSSNPTYINVKGRPLYYYGESDKNNDFNGADANCTLNSGDSLELTINPDSTSIFTIYRRYLTSELNEDGKNVSPVWKRKSLVGINAWGQFYSNAVQDNKSTMTISNIGAFGKQANPNITKYVGAAFAYDEKNIVKLFIDAEKEKTTDKVTGEKNSPLYISTGNTTIDEYPRTVNIYGKSLNLYASPKKESALQSSDYKLTLSNSNAFFGHSYVEVNNTDPENIKYTDYSNYFQIDSTSSSSNLKKTVKIHSNDTLSMECANSFSLKLGGYTNNDTTNDGSILNMAANSNGVTTKLQEGDCLFSIGTENSPNKNSSSITNTIYSKNTSSKYNIALKTTSDNTNYNSNLGVGCSNFNYTSEVDTKTEKEAYIKLDNSSSSDSELDIQSNIIAFNTSSNYQYVPASETGINDAGLIIDGNLGKTLLYQRVATRTDTNNTNIDSSSGLSYLLLNTQNSSATGFELMDGKNGIFLKSSTATYSLGTKEYHPISNNQRYELSGYVNIGQHLQVNGIIAANQSLYAHQGVFITGTVKVNDNCNYGLYSINQIKSIAEVGGSEFIFNSDLSMDGSINSYYKYFTCNSTSGDISTSSTDPKNKRCISNHLYAINKALDYTSENIDNLNTYLNGKINSKVSNSIYSNHSHSFNLTGKTVSSSNMYTGSVADYYGSDLIIGYYVENDSANPTIQRTSLAQYNNVAIKYNTSIAYVIINGVSISGKSSTPI
jgi:hypothetical protein